MNILQTWDYLVVTASNAEQAAAYEMQLGVRHRLGLLPGIRNVLAIGDPGGKRVGSGGSTVFCLMEILRRELAGATLGDPAAWLTAMQRLRILIVHGGGDSRRLPAYGPCGKVFVPVPGESDSAIGMAMFDRQLPIYLQLPQSPEGVGQVVMAAGDVLLSFNPKDIRLEAGGITGLACPATPRDASKHGVFCAGANGKVRLFLQKPSPQQQASLGAVDRYGQSMLDIGVMNFDAQTAVRLLEMCQVRPAGGGLSWSGEMGAAIERCGLDFYREICCALGSEATVEQHAVSALDSGSRFSRALLGEVFAAMRAVEFSVRVLPRCGFLHFGTTRQIISSGADLLREDRGVAAAEDVIGINNEMIDGGGIAGVNSWVEGCRLGAMLTLTGENVVVGVDVNEPLTLGKGQCLDVLKGRDPSGRAVWFARCYGVDDSFKHALGQGATFCGLSMEDWLDAAGADPEGVWDAGIEPDARTAWDARLFRAVDSPDGYRELLWMFDPGHASAAQKDAWRAANRYSLSEIALLADQDAFHRRREAVHGQEIRRSLRRMFRLESRFSARDLSYVLGQSPEAGRLAAEVVAEAQWHFGCGAAGESMEAFVFSRVLHTLGSALHDISRGGAAGELWEQFRQEIRGPLAKWLESLELAPRLPLDEWAAKAQSVAFDHLGKAIMFSTGQSRKHPRNVLRSDEIVWGRAPARLDLGGGWTDTPPYSLEHGGCVINAAIDLNGQPPIQAYARVIREPLIRITSIDLGTRIEVRTLDELLDYRRAEGDFALAKAALAISGFAPPASRLEDSDSLATMLEWFGGGIELTTLAAVPKGSGLGTSSIVGAVILGTLSRLQGLELTRQELYHGVLCLEQALTTGGGWQDQIGGAVEGVKVISAEAGMIPNPVVHHVPSEVLDPRLNGGCTLLYYTGITRLAKNILRQVVGRYLSRDRGMMRTLGRLHVLPNLVSEAMSRKDIRGFGELIDVAWRLNKELDPDSSTPVVDGLLERIGPHLHGAKLLGAGGGGFLLMVCKSPEDARAVKATLTAEPPNPRARFFDFEINRRGLEITVC